MKVELIPIDKIRPAPWQPREKFDKGKIGELGDSIKRVDLLSPIVVRKEGNTYQIIAGERRWRAWHEIGRKEIPAIVRAADKTEAMELSLIENWHREDLTSVERENMVYALWKSGRYDTRVELARALGADDATIRGILLAREIRAKENVPSELSTSVIKDTFGLEEEDRSKLLRKVSLGEVESSKVGEYVRTVKKAPEPVKKALLKPKSKITLEDAKRIAKLPSKEHIEEAIKIIEGEEGLYEEAREIRLREIEDIATGRREIPIEVEDMNEAIVLSYKNAYENIYKLLASRVGELPKKHREACIGYMLKAHDFLTKQIYLLRKEGLIKDIEMDGRVPSLEEKK